MDKLPLCWSRGRSRRLGRGGGLTAFEVLIVAALLGTVTVMAVPAFYREIQETANTRVIVDIQVLQFAIDMYERMNERLPDSLDDLGPGPRVDHWGNPYQYLPSTAEHWDGHQRLDQHQVPLNDDYDLFSPGPDGEWKRPLMNPKSKDDIVRADDGLFIGVAVDH